MTTMDHAVTLEVLPVKGGGELEKIFAEIEDGGRTAMARILIAIGVFLILVGLFWPVLAKFPLGRLPGDIVYRKDNFTFYLPLGSSVVVSLLLTFLFWLFRK